MVFYLLFSSFVVLAVCVWFLVCCRPVNLHSGGDGTDCTKGRVEAHRLFFVKSVDVGSLRYTLQRLVYVDIIRLLHGRVGAESTLSDCDHVAGVLDAYLNTILGTSFLLS